MKRKFSALLITMIYTVYLCAQVTNKLNYQAVARNAGGMLLTNQSIGLLLTVEDSSGGTMIYKERHTPTTNQFGLFTVQIGNGTALFGNYNSIPWSNGNIWLKVDMDPTGGSSYTAMGESQLLSVPYALYAATSGNTPFTHMQVFSSPGTVAFTIPSDAKKLWWRYGVVAVGVVQAAMAAAAAVMEKGFTMYCQVQSLMSPLEMEELAPVLQHKMATQAA